MASTSETGHAKNVANFNNLIHLLYGMGTLYNPATDNLQLNNLRAQHTNALLAIDEVKKQKAGYDTAVNTRADLFNKIPRLITRISATLKANAIPAKDLDNAAGYIAKLRGTRRGKPVNTAGTATNPDQPAPNTASAVQLSFDQQLDSMSKLYHQIEQLPGYLTNDADLSKPALATFLKSLTEANETVSAHTRDLREARLTRDKALYDPVAGLVVTAGSIKNYLKSLPGGNSNPDYKTSVKLKFRLLSETLRPEAR